MKTYQILAVGVSVLPFTLISQAEVQVLVERLPSDAAAFQFERVPAPSKGDAAASGAFSIVFGAAGPEGHQIEVGMINDDQVPAGEDVPSANFFFAPGTVAGRIVVDLGDVIEVSQVNSYSWHPSSRAPQVYTLYVSDGVAESFNPAPPEDVSPLVAGWTRLIDVNTRPEEEEVGGQYGVSISDSEGSLGNCRYLLFDIQATDETDRFSNTFYGEIDVLAVGAEAQAIEIPRAKEVEFAEGAFKVRLDTAAAPDLEAWASEELAPVIEEWYPKIVAMLASEGFEAPEEFTIRFRDNMGGTPASASNRTINCNSDWFRTQLDREAKGAVVHEMVHIVQQYPRNRRKPNPGWLVEGLADYIRWFLYEPETGGGQISRRNLANANYSSSYRITGNFLDWVTRTKDPEIVTKLNAAMREGSYDAEIWQTITGTAVEDLNEAWKRDLEAQLDAAEAEAEADQ